MTTLRAEGFEVFCDLKLYDIPTTVRRATRVVGTLGARYLNSPAAAGTATLEAMVDGFTDGAAVAGTVDPVPLAVTVLTSEALDHPDLLADRVAIAAAAGCAGVVCGAPDLATVRAIAPSLCTVVPGIRPAGAALDDQVRVATPQEAIAAGAGVLVVGRAVSRAPDPAAAAAMVAEQAAAGLARAAGT